MTGTALVRLGVPTDATSSQRVLVVREVLRRLPELQELASQGTPVLEHRDFGFSVVDLEHALARLSSQKRKAVELVLVLDHLHRDAAAIMGTQIATVSQYVMAAIEDIADTLFGPVVLDAAEARDLTDRIRKRTAELWGMLLELYRGRGHVSLGYASWSEYCAAEFGIEKSHAYRLLDAAAVVESLPESPMGERPSERVARELAPVNRKYPDRVEGVWEAIIAHFGPAPTAAEVRSYVQGFLRSLEAPVEEAKLAVKTGWQLDTLRTGLKAVLVVETQATHLAAEIAGLEAGDRAGYLADLGRAVACLGDLQRDLEAA